MENPEAVPAELRPALRELLLALADDELVTGYVNSEWTGIAPILEEDIAFSSLAQDELGHARLLYELLAQLEGCGVDELAYGRPPEGYRHAQLVERPRGDWSYSVARQLLYDTADSVRLEALRQSAYAPLAQAAASIIREEKYHLLHAQTWLRQLASAGPEAQARQRAAFEALWPDAPGLFEPFAGEQALLDAAILTCSSGLLLQRWLDQIAAPLEAAGLSLPFARGAEGWEVQPSTGGGRRGVHSAAFVELHQTITSVFRLEPGATW